jgi:adenosylcobinamide kinase / adenosylcobinamide-phosphate guanylyltransferase
MLTLVLGGVRSGKSEFAERLAPKVAARVVYLAPGRAWDGEMAERIRLHQERRNPDWVTVEEPLEIPQAVRQYGAAGVCLLLDGLGTWVSNLLLDEVPEAEILRRVGDLLAAVAETGASAVVVSDEVGLGLISTTPLGRQFQDALGRANQQVAARAQRAFLVTAGIAVDLKALEVQP